MKKGFTLIEMLIVVAIIAVLASVVLIGVGPVQRQGRDARRVSDLRQVQNGLELYFNRCGFYPGTTNCASGVAGTYNSVAAWNTFKGILTGSGLGITNVPDDPTNSGNFYYRYASAGTPPNTYVLGAQLEDTNSASLRTDIDGTVSGISCVDPVYCVQL